MTTIIEKIVSVCMAFVLVMAFAPNVVCAQAADSVYEGSGTQADPWLVGASSASDVTAYVSGTTLYVEGSGAMCDFVDSEDGTRPPWSPTTNGNSTITSLVIGEGVTATGKLAFLRCKALVSISFPTTLTTLGNSSFWYCTGIEELSLPSTVSTVDASAFAYCESLSTLSLASGVSSIGAGAFSYCPELDSITFYHRASSTLSIGRRAFYEESESGLETSIYVPFADDVNSAISDYTWAQSDYRTINIVAMYALPDAPKLFYVSKKSPTSVTFSWTSARGVDGYVLYRKKAGTYKKVARINNAMTTSKIISSLSAAKRYTFALRCFAAFDGVEGTFYSEYKTVSVKTAAARIVLNAKKVSATVIAKAAKKLGLKTAKLTQVILGTKVRAIAKKAFAKCTKCKNLVIKTKKLSRKHIKDCLKGSKVKTVKVPKAKLASYKKLFSAKLCGRKVKVKAI